MKTANQKNELIYSNSKGNLYMSWFLSMAFSLVTIPIIMNGYDNADGIGEILILSIFPFVHLLILIGTIRSTIERIKYQSTPLQLDPQVGSLTGDIGGVISLGKSFKEGDVFRVVLKNERATRTYSYDHDRERRPHIERDLIWEDDGFVSVEKIAGKLSIQFLFQMNRSGKKFETKSEGKTSYYWELSLSEKKSGFSRTFIIPVKKGSSKAKNLTLNTSKYLPKGVRKASVYTLLPLVEKKGMGTLSYPSFYNPLPLQAFGIFGSIFFLIGLGMMIFGEDTFVKFMGALFSIPGISLILFGMYQTIVERKLIYDKHSIQEEKFLFGMKFFKKIYRINKESKIVFLDISLSKTTKELSSFSSIAIESQGKKVILANHIQSIKEQKIIKQYFENYFK